MITYKPLLKSREMYFYACIFNKKTFYLTKSNVNLKDYKKEHTKYVCFLFASIVLLGFLTISVFYNIVGGFSFERINEYMNLFGQESIIKLESLGSSSVSYNFTGNVVNNLEYSQNVFVELSSQIPDCKIRAKAYVSLLDGSVPVQIYGFTNWLDEGGEYIYFEQVISSGEKIGLCRYLRFSDTLFFQSTKTYILTILVEAVGKDSEFVI